MMSRKRGFSLIELLVVVAIILIIAAIAIPNLLRARISANEASAVRSLRTIATAQIAYATSYPKIGYAADLTRLAPPAGGISPMAAGLLDASLSTAPFQHSGYTFASVGDLYTFSATATPIVLDRTGVRMFCTNTPVVIYYSPTGVGCVTDGTSPPAQ